jgi:hypothetical protein
VLATAPSVYVANATLDSIQTTAQYGFTVLGDGVGTATFNVGSGGEAFGVGNDSTMTVAFEDIRQSVWKSEWVVPDETG